MVLKLNGADFSANNLGQIEVTTVLHPFTEAAILASGNNSLTQIQKSALNALFLAMGVDGSNDVMSKMHKVYLPILAADLSKAMINYQNDSFTNDKTLSSSNWTLRSHGVVGIANGNYISFTESNPVTATNISQIFLRTELMEAGADDTSSIFTFRGKTDTSKFMGFAQTSASSNGYITAGNYGSWNAGKGKNRDIIAAVAMGGNAETYYTNFNDSAVFTNYSARTTPDMSAETSETVYVFGINTTNLTKPYAIAMYGEYITRAQAELICEKINNLWAVFNV